MRFFSKYVKKVYTGTKLFMTECVELFCNTWIYGWLGARKMISIHRRTYELLIITGSFYYTDEVKTAIRHIKTRTVDAGYLNVLPGELYR